MMVSFTRSTGEPVEETKMACVLQVKELPSCRSMCTKLLLKHSQSAVLTIPYPYVAISSSYIV